MNCRVNTTYFVRNHEILFKYFQENKEQIPWKQVHSNIVFLMENKRIIRMYKF